MDRAELFCCLTCWAGFAASLALGRVCGLIRFGRRKEKGR